MTDEPRCPKCGGALAWPFNTTTAMARCPACRWVSPCVYGTVEDAQRLVRELLDVQPEAEQHDAGFGLGGK